MKKQFLLLLLFAEFIARPLFGQKACNTLYTTNGAQILIEIVHAYTHGLVYTKSEEDKGFRYYTISDEILETLYQNPEMRSVISFNQKKSTKDTNGLSSPKFIIWAGFDLLNSVGYGSYSLGFPIQFGIEMGFAGNSMRLGLSFQPYYFRGSHREDGTGIEAGIVAKKLSVGRLSGRTNIGYWGLDVRVGQQPYTSEDAPHKRIEYSWLKIMPCIGLHFSKDAFAIDFRLPIGVEFLSAEGTNYAQNWEDLAVEPTLSIGLRF